MSKNKYMLTGVITLMMLCSCTQEEPKNSNSSSSQTEVDDYSLSMKVSATSSNIILEIEGSGTQSSKEAKLKIVSLPAYQYLKGDNTSGLITSFVDVSDANFVGDYTFKNGTDTISIDRIGGRESEVYDDESESYVTKNLPFDNLYNKYYVVDEDEIVLGPIYCTDIESICKEEPTFNIKSKKGLFGEDLAAYKDLGCSYATLNLEISNLIMPNEYYFDGERINLEHSDDEISFVSNGKTFYFNPKVVAQYDKEISSYYENGASISAILIASPTDDEQKFP